MTLHSFKEVFCNLQILSFPKLVSEQTIVFCFIIKNWFEKIIENLQIFLQDLDVTLSKKVKNWRKMIPMSKSNFFNSFEISIPCWLKNHLGWKDSVKLAFSVPPYCSGGETWGGSQYVKRSPVNFVTKEGGAVRQYFYTKEAASIVIYLWIFLYLN